MTWYVIHEYETYKSPKKEPIHAWYINSTHNTKEAAEAKALELNYDKYCRDMPERCLQRSLTAEATINEKYKSVIMTLKNIHKCAGSKNQWRGIGYFIIDNKRIKLGSNIKNVKYIWKYLEKEEVSAAKNDDSDDDEEEDYDEDDEEEDNNSDKDNVEEDVEEEEEENETKSKKNVESPRGKKPTASDDEEFYSD